MTITTEDHLQRPSAPDQTRQALRAAEARDQAEAGLGQAQAGLGAAQRTVQASASSRPPPRAKPPMAAITGLPRFSICHIRLWPAVA